MTDDELEAIEARAKNATPGPWRFDYGYDLLDNQGNRVLLGAYVRTEKPMGPYPGLRDDVTSRMLGARRMISEVHTLECSDGEPRHAGSADGHFIASAREDIPKLIAEIRRLRDAIRST